MNSKAFSKYPIYLVDRDDFEVVTSSEWINAWRDLGSPVLVDSAVVRNFTRQPSGVRDVKLFYKGRWIV